MVYDLFGCRFLETRGIRSIGMDGVAKYIIHMGSWMWMMIIIHFGYVGDGKGGVCVYVEQHDLCPVTKQRHESCTNIH